MVKSGVVLHINATLDTSVYSKAVFSVTKYKVPPISPPDRHKASSLSVSANSLIGRLQRQMQPYANMNRHNKMSEGPSPASKRDLEDTKVVPHTITTSNANI